MATVKFERVVSYSSEDPRFPANNLLKLGSKWVCKGAGEDRATVILQLEQPVELATVDVGNQHSAFVHVLVGRAASDKYETLIPASSFMSPLESDQSTNANRVRMFSKEDFLLPAASEKWDRIKVECTQPFNRRVQYGLAFIVVTQHADKPPAPVPLGTFKAKDEGWPRVHLGRFRLKEDGDASVAVGSFFAKRKELADGGDAAAANGASEGAQGSGMCTAVWKVHKLGAKTGADSVPAGAAGPRRSPLQPLPVAVKRKADAAVSPRTATPPPKAAAEVTAPRVALVVKAAPWSAKAEPSVAAGSAPNKRRPEKPRKPFGRLLEGVTLVISGYVNPGRADIRSKAMQMGAKYKQDWDQSCTHLICAFASTPKFRQVKGRGNIVCKDWIEQCFIKRARLPWRRFALDMNDFKQPESEEEILEEVVESLNSDSRSSSPEDVTAENAVSHGCQAASGSDTEDEMDRLEANRGGASWECNPYLSDTDVEEEAREDTSHLPMPPLPKRFAAPPR